MQVTTIEDKKIRVKIPAGTQNGKVMRVKGEGIPYLNNPSRRGDLYIKLRVDIPGKLSSRAKELLREFASLNGEDDSPEPIALSEIKRG